MNEADLMITGEQDCEHDPAVSLPRPRHYTHSQTKTEL